MHCAPRYQWGLFGSLFFFAVVAGSLIFTPLADRVGRKKVVFYGILIQAIAGTLILYSTSKTFSYFLCFMFGLCMPMRVFVGFIFCMEFLPIKSTQLAAATILGLDNLMLMAASVFFMWFSKEWKALFGMGTFASYVCLVLVHHMPESPKYLVNKNRFEEARKVITEIAQFNQI